MEKSGMEEKRNSPETLTRGDFPERARALAAKFPELRAIIKRHGIPEFWSRPSGFETLVLIILEQQVSLLAAGRAFERIEKGVGKVDSRKIFKTGVEGLKALGITRQKSRYIFELAKSIEGGNLDLPSLEKESDDSVFEKLTSLPGIGPWTARVYLLAALCRPDIWPPGDLALKKTIRKLIPGAGEELERSGERWAPERAVAARLLWHEYLS